MDIVLSNEFETIGLDEMYVIDGGGFWSSVIIGAVFGAASTVLLAASCGTLAPVVVAGIHLSKTAVTVAVAAGGAVGGGLSGAIKGALN